MKRIFVSYSRADYIDEMGQIIEGSAVNIILKSLKASSSIDVWIDVNAKYSGKYFTSVSAKRIQWADKVLFLSSINSNSSEWVSKEILYAYDNKKEILPVLLDNSTFNVDFALILTGIDYIEYYKNPEQRISSILDNILEDSQQEEEKCIEDVEVLQTQDTVTPTIEGNKNSLSLNINYKGCAMSMTVLLGLLFLIGLFVPVDTESNKEGSLAYNENIIEGVESIQQAKKEDSVSYISPKSSESQVAQRTSVPLSNGKKKKHPSSSTNSNPNKDVPSVSDEQAQIAQKANTESRGHTASVPDEGTLVAQSDGKQGNTPSVISGRSGAVAGPRRIRERVSANSSDIYNMVFKGGELAAIVVSGDGDTDLDVYVYDSEGNLVTSDVDSSDDCVIQWHPRWTGTFRIVIKNKGNVYNNYTLVTNQ